MKVLGIYGSPRKGGNTDQLLDEALNGAKSLGADISTIYVRRLKISGCLECGGCDRTGKCVVQDEMQTAYPLLEEADRIILASPIFFYGISAQAKTLVDRCQAMWSKRMLQKNKEDRKSYNSGVGYLIAAGATRGENLFDGSQLTARYFFDALDMSFEGGIFFRRLEDKTAVNDHPQTLQEAFHLGRKAAA